MRKLLYLSLALPALSAGTTPDVDLSLEVSSAHVWRGITCKDTAVIQPGIEISRFPVGDAILPLSFSSWGYFDTGRGKRAVRDDEGNPLRTREGSQAGSFSEIDFMLGLEAPCKIKELGVFAGYLEYIYPQSGDDPNRQVMLSLDYDAALKPALALYYGVDGALRKSAFLEFGLYHSTPLTDRLLLELRSQLGYSIPDSGKSGWSNLNLGASLSMGPFSASLTYIAQLDDAVLPDELYDTRMLGTLAFNHSF